RKRSCSPLSFRSRGRIASPRQSSQKASESQIKFARNPDPKARFPAKPVTAKCRFWIPNQQLGISSRTTI
ncbi:hypothetical protein, partial [Bradyrhizobium sp. CW10]|uniref:hypothetical protein n=1 Tax=Bradyrhizobium sp. CW10 TaxID=2782683 RepID=UPI001FFAEAFB